MIRALLAIVTLLSLVAGGAKAALVKIDFRLEPIVDNPSGNGEISGLEWISRGIIIYSPIGTLNVGCGSTPCVGAEFAGETGIGLIGGNFLDPHANIGISVTNLSIDLYGSPYTVISLYDLDLNLLYSSTGTDLVNYAGPVASFQISLFNDAIFQLSWDDGTLAPPTSAPAPPALLLIGLGLLGFGAIRRRA